MGGTQRVYCGNKTTLRIMQSSCDQTWAISLEGSQQWDQNFFQGSKRRFDNTSPRDRTETSSFFLRLASKTFFTTAREFLQSNSCKWMTEKKHRGHANKTSTLQ